MKKLWLVMALAALGCGKKKDESTEKKEPPPAPTTVDAAAAAVAPPDAPPAPKFPPLGAPPEGLDPKLATACDAGDGKACLDAARAYEPKGAFRVDMSKEEGDRHVEWTARYGERACQYDLGEGCALHVRFGTLATAEAQHAVLRRGCDLGHMGSCGELGTWLVRDAKTATEGLALLEKACRADGVYKTDDPHGKLCAELADLLTGNGTADVPKDAAKAKEMRALACQQGAQLGCPCTDDTVEKDCGPSTDTERWMCDEGVCGQMAPG